MLSKFITTVEYLNYLIRIEGTGDPKSLARRLDVSVRAIYKYVSCLKEMGAPIAYNRHRQTYYYTKRVDFLCKFEPITDNPIESKHYEQETYKQNPKYRHTVTAKKNR